MNITDHASSLFASHADLTTTEPTAPTSSDANLFSQALNEPDFSSENTSMNGGLIHKTSEFFKQVDDQKNRMDTLLHHASRSTDPTVMNKAEGQLSNYYLENTLNTKIVSKAVQSLDKITNLQ